MRKKHRISILMPFIPLLALLALLSCETTGSQVKGSQQPLTRGDFKITAQNIEGIRARAEAGDAYFQAILGGGYVRGYFVRTDLREALKWLEPASRKENPIALYHMAQWYGQGNDPDKGAKKAAEFYAMAVPGLKAMAEEDNAEAQVDLAYCQAYGRGTVKNMEEALRWARRAAGQGHPVAQAFLGARYYFGDGVSKDYDEAYEWFEKAAAQQYSYAIADLGRMHLEGHGVRKNPARARELFLQGVEMNNGQAQFLLGRMYYEGTGVPKDVKSGVEWYRKSAEAGNSAGRAALNAHFKKSHNISAALIPIVRHKLPPAGEWVETGARMNEAYKIRYRTVLSKEELLSLGIEPSLDNHFLEIAPNGGRLLLARNRIKDRGQAYSLVDLASRECQVAELKDFPEVNPISPAACFWREGDLLLTKDDRSALEVMPDSEGRDFWSIRRAVPFKKELPGGWGDWQLGSQVADPDTGTIIRFVRFGKERLKNGKKEFDFTIYQLPLRFKWENDEFNGKLELYRWPTDMPLKASIESEKKHFSALDARGTNISGGALSKQGFFYLANPLIYSMEERFKNDVYQFGRDNLATHVWHAPRKGDGFGDARYVGRVNTGYIGLEWVLGGGAVSPGGKYAFIRNQLVDLARPAEEHTLRRIDFEDLDKSFKPAALAFDPADDRHLYIINSFYPGSGIDYSVVEIYLPDDFDDLMALTGDFLLKECGSDTGLCRAQQDQAEKGFERLAALLDSRPDIKGRDETLETLLGYGILWKGRDNLQMKTLGRWQNLPGMNKGLKAWIMARRAGLLHKTGFKEEGADLFREAVGLDASKIFDKKVHYYMGGSERLAFLKEGTPLSFAGRLLVAAADQRPEKRDKALFDYCLFASAAGQPGLALQGVERVKSMALKGEIRLEKQDQDLLVLIEALAIAGMEREEEAYSLLLKHGSFEKAARDRVLKDSDLFAPLYRDTAKLAVILGVDKGKLKRPEYCPVPQAYVDLEGNLIQPATAAPALEARPGQRSSGPGSRAAPAPKPREKKGPVVLD